MSDLADIVEIETFKKGFFDQLVEALIFAAAVDLVDRKFKGKMVHLIVLDEGKQFDACEAIGAVQRFGPFGKRTW